MKLINKGISIIAGLCITCFSLHLTAGVIAYWDFSSDSNGVTDVSGYYHTLVNNGVVISNGAAVFDGTHTAFNTASTLNLSSYTKLTVECFVRTASPTQSMILEHSEDLNSYSGSFFFYLPNTSGELDATTKLLSSYHIDYAPAGTLSDGDWHHVAWVYDSTITTTNRYRLYVDGVQQLQHALASTTDALLLNKVLYIGSRANSGLKFTGELDDLRISDQARSPSEFLTERTEGTPQVVANWTFEDGSAYADASGNGNTLTGSGVTFTDNAAIFDGNQTALNTVGNLDLSAFNSLTVECFMRVAPSGNGMVFEHGNNIGTPAKPGGFFFYLPPANPGRMVTTLKTVNGWHQDLSADGVMNDAHWHHVAWVYNKAINNHYRYTQYVDGVLQNQDSASSSITDTDLRNDILYIGSRGNDSIKFIGELDDLRITARALTPIQFQKSPTTERFPGVVAYWPFSARSPLTDASGNGHSLTNSGVNFNNGAAVFDGTHTVFSTQPSTLNLYLYSALTLEYFIKTTSTDVFVVTEHSDNFNTSRGGFITTLNEVNNGQLQGGFSMADNTYNIDATPADSVTDGMWHHVAVVYDPDSGGDDRVRLYLDGVQQGKRTEGLHISDTGLAFLNDVLYIGSRADSSSKFIGELDDVRITGAVLTPAEFMTERSGSGGTLVLIQ